MLGQLISYSGIASKVRAMYGRRLKTEDFQRLSSMSSVPEIAAYLKTHPGWSSVLSDVNPSDIHRAQLESRIRQHLLNEYQRIFKFMSKNDQPIMRYPLLRTEMDQIMVFLRFLKAGRPQDYEFSAPAFYKLHSRIAFDSLKECETYTAFLDVIEKTDFYPPLAALTPSAGAPIDYPAIENILRGYYYNILLEAMDRHYRGEIRVLLKRSIGMQIDLLNIVRVIRLRKFYKSPGADIKKYLIPVYSGIKPEFLNRLFAAESDEQQRSLLLSSPYKRVFSENDFPHVEDYYYRQLYDFNRHHISSGSPSVYTPIAYLTLKEIEIKDLINIIELVRYDTTPGEASVTIEGLK